MKFILFCLFVASSCAQEQPIVLGNWAFQDCILAQFSMNITIHPQQGNTNISSVVVIPPSARVDEQSSTCGNVTANEDQRLVLTWDDPGNETEILERDVTIIFRRNIESSYYGVYQFYGEFITNKWIFNGTMYKTKVSVDSGEVQNILFHTPLDRSFTCSEWGSTQLKTKATTEADSKVPISLANSTVHTSMLKFDAFRVTSRGPPPTGFRTPLDCEYEPNDIVPIAVGVALAVLVIVVLIAYVIGRRRNRQRGYESV